jgi:hypothetical protein
VIPHEPKHRCTAEAPLEGALEEDVVRCLRGAWQTGQSASETAKMFFGSELFYGTIY